MALTAGVIPVANVPTAVAAPAQDIVAPSSPKATGMQNSVTAMLLPNTELESKVEVKREMQPEGSDEDDGYGYSSSTANSSLAAAGNCSVENKIRTHQSRMCFSLRTGSSAFTARRMCSLNSTNASFQWQSVKLSVAVKKEEDFGLQIKEENLRDGHCGEMHPERGVKENSDKKGDKETSRGDDSPGDGSTEVRKTFFCSI